jgi:hypothetical protein
LLLLRQENQDNHDSSMPTVHSTQRGTMIIIPNYRSSFAELQVGDQFLTSQAWGTSYVPNAVTRLTPKWFVRGFGKPLDSKKNICEYEDVYRRDNGQRVGGHRSDSNAILPTPELIAQINQEVADRATMNELASLDFRFLNPEQARQVIDLFKSFAK